MPSRDLEFCKSCIYAKATHKPVAKAHEGECASTFGEEVHLDLWGPAPVATLWGCCYYVSFTDDKTQHTSLYLLWQKSDTLATYKEYEVDCCTQFGARIRVLHSDGGSEYTGREFTLHLKHSGTCQKLTVHDTLQHNGITKHLNHTILEKVRAMLHSSGGPAELVREYNRGLIGLD